VKKRFSYLVVLTCIALGVSGASEDSLLHLLEGSRDSVRVRLLCELASATYPSDYAKGLAYAGTALDEAKQKHYAHLQSRAELTIGVIHFYKGEYEQALAFYLAAKKTAGNSGDLLASANIDLEIGNLYKKTNRPGKALEFLHEAGKIFLEQGNKEALANLYNNIGLLCEMRPDLDSAACYYQQALTLYREAGIPLGASYSLDYLSGVYLQKKDHAEALRYELQSLDLRKTLGNLQALAISYNNAGEIYLDMGDDKNAVAYFEEAIRLSRKIGYPDLAQYSSTQAAKCYAHLKNTGKAYEYLSLATSIKDSLYSQTQSRQLAEMQTRYETEKKQQENELLARQNEIKDLELEKKQRTIYLTLGVALAGMTILLLVYTGYRNRQRALFSREQLRQEQLRNRAILITQENERKRIAEELHDGIGQMMSAVKLNMAALEPKLKEKDEQYQNALSLIDDSCRELRSISHNMMPGILIKAGLVPAVKELVSRINSSGSISISVEAEDPKVRLGETLEVNFFRIIQELITNIIKYANASQAQVSLSVENGIFTIMIEDNGKGFDKAVLVNSPGNGWNNILSRLNLLNGKIEIDSQPGKGTVVFIEAPLIT
jgi:signal transduction histidine kinase